MIKTSSVWALVWYQLVPWVALDPSRRESRLYTNILSLPLCYYYFSSIKCPKNSWYTNHTVYRNSVCMRYDAIILFIFAAAAFAIREHWQITRSAHINTFINNKHFFINTLFQRPETIFFCCQKVCHLTWPCYLWLKWHM